MSLPTPPPDDDPFVPPEQTTPPPAPSSSGATPPAPPSYGAPPPATPYGAPPPPPAYGAAPGYGTPGYGLPRPGNPTPGPAYGGYGAPENGQGTTALVTGILGLLCCGLLSIVAIVTGRRGMALADEGRADNRGTAQAGMVLGWVGVGLWLVGVVGYLLFALAVGASSSFGGG